LRLPKYCRAKVSFTTATFAPAIVNANTRLSPHIGVAASGHRTE
jgi:hypothetical protein